MYLPAFYTSKQVATQIQKKLSLKSSKLFVLSTLFIPLKFHLAIPFRKYLLCVVIFECTFYIQNVFHVFLLFILRLSVSYPLFFRHIIHLFIRLPYAQNLTQKDLYPRMLLLIKQFVCIIQKLVYPNCTQTMFYSPFFISETFSIRPVITSFN